MVVAGLVKRNGRSWSIDHAYGRVRDGAGAALSRDSLMGSPLACSVKHTRRVTLHPSAVAPGVTQRQREVRLIMLPTIERTWRKLNASVS